jgi:hypothetical protein
LRTVEELYGEGKLRKVISVDYYSFNQTYSHFLTWLQKSLWCLFFSFLCLLGQRVIPCWC